MNNKIAFLTGITGQCGGYLAELLLSKDYQVHGLVRPNSASGNVERIRHIMPQLHLHYGDITDSIGLKRILSEVQPDEVYNLAAQSHVHISFKQPVYTVMADALGVMNLLEAIRSVSTDIKFCQASSSEMFGKVSEAPQTEKTPFHPRSPYACAKVYSYWQTLNYRESYGMFCCNSINFNNESPRRGENFVTRKITRAAGRIKEGLQDKLFLGNLDAKRDWGFSGDTIDAMHLILQADRPDDYVISTGKTHSVKEFLDETFGYLDLDWSKYVEIDPKFYRPAEVNLLLGDSTKAKEVLGWEPKVGFKELAKMMVESDWELAKKEAKKLECIR